MAARAIPIRSGSTLMIRAFVRNRLSVAGAVLILAIVAAGLLAPLLAPYDPNLVAIEDKLSPPSANHPLGADQFGRDLLSRILFGARVSLAVGLGATTVAGVAGVAAGALAGYRGGWLDELIMRFIDILLAFPFIVLAIGLMVVFGTSVLNLIMVIGVLRIAQFARVTRASVLSLKEREFVLASRASGQQSALILFRHILPNALAPLLVLASLSTATAINAEAALSFLGVGIQPPDASWGTLIADGRTYLVKATWIATFPGLAISLTVLGCNLIGDGLRDAFDPRTRTGPR